jgi:hypothetical protein
MLLVHWHSEKIFSRIFIWKPDHLQLLAEVCKSMVTRAKNRVCNYGLATNKPISHNKFKKSLRHGSSFQALGRSLQHKFSFTVYTPFELGHTYK